MILRTSVQCHVGGAGSRGTVLRVEGWGKETAVRMLYTQYKLQINPFIIPDSISDCREV